ncbi:Uncharacterised protein [Segatella oris]|uniref:Uncharacterized protein n=1 Tax=Segatella oris TaxID=28135 RepID=A0A448L6L4_9BACT|nr:Uncharacterised protein [Segatella oris]
MELHEENYLVMLMTIQRYTRHALMRYIIKYPTLLPFKTSRVPHRYAVPATPSH